jgi:hypothetical protein
MQQHGYLVLCYVLGSAVAASFAAYAMVYARIWGRTHNKDTEDFITARTSQNMWRVGWSFFAGGLGATAIITPSQARSRM